MSVPWMPLYVADYLADTGHLNAAEHGAYMLLIMHYWRQGSLPTEDGHLQRIARMTTIEWKRSRETLASLFQDGWRHKRIEEELDKSRVKSVRRAEAGARGGNSKASADKALKSMTGIVANASDLPQQNEDFALASSSQPQSQATEIGCREPNLSSSAKAADGRMTYRKAFEIWYGRYPKKKGRLAAVKAFERVLRQKIATLDQLLIGVDRYVKHGDPKFRHDPATWLNAGHWLDEYPGAPPLTGSADPADPRIDFGGGISASLSRIRQHVEQKRWRTEWGPRPEEPGCRVPREFWGQILPKKSMAEQPQQLGLLH